MDPLYIKLYAKKPSSDFLIELMKLLYDFQAAKNFKAIDKILGEINSNRLDDVIIISLLRCNFPIRTKLQNWNSFLSKAKKKYAGTDKEKILLGLELKEE
jgi:hypothetical protein